MVTFRTAEGKPAFHQADGVDEAVRFVEHLRNEEQVTDARIFEMSEVPIEFKVHWRVEIATPPAAEAFAPEEAAEAVTTEEGIEPVPVAVSAIGEADTESAAPLPPASSSAASSRFGLFGRS